jgi:hypothetical protein
MIKIGEKKTVLIRAIKVFISISWLKKIQCQSLLEFLLVAAKYSKFLFISCRKQTVQKKSSNGNLNLFAQLTTATLLLNDKIATAPVMHFQNAMKTMFKDPNFLPGGIFLDHWMQAELIYGHVIYLEFTWPGDLDIVYRFEIQWLLLSNFR